MVTPKQLDFSSSGVTGDSDDTLPRRKSPRNPAASNAEIESEEETKKKKKNKKKKLASSVIKRIWNEEDELVVLKRLVDYRAKTGFQSKIDWDGFYRFVGGPIVAKFSKEQVLSKIRKLKRRFLVHLEKINQRNDPNFTRSSDSEAFGFSMMLWGQNEAEVGNDGMDNSGAADKPDDGTALKGQQSKNVESLDTSGAAKTTDNQTAGKAQDRETGEEMLKEHEELATVDSLNTSGAAKIRDNLSAGKALDRETGEKMLKEHEEVTNLDSLNTSGAAKITDNQTARKAQDRETGEEMLKEHEEVVNVETLTENGALNVTENGTACRDNRDDDDELCAVRDAFETITSQDLSDYQKKLQLEKLMKLGTGKRRELSDEWKALCAEERTLKIKKLRFSVKLAEAANDS